MNLYSVAYPKRSVEGGGGQLLKKKWNIHIKIKFFLGKTYLETLPNLRGGGGGLYLRTGGIHIPQPLTLLNVL